MYLVRMQSILAAYKKTVTSSLFHPSKIDHRECIALIIYIPVRYSNIPFIQFLRIFSLNANKLMN